MKDPREFARTVPEAPVVAVTFTRSRRWKWLPCTSIDEPTCIVSRGRLAAEPAAVNSSAAKRATAMRPSRRTPR